MLQQLLTCGPMALRRVATAIMAIGALFGFLAMSSEAAILGGQERTDWSGIQGWACDDAALPSEKIQVYPVHHAAWILDADRQRHRGQV